MKTYLGHCCHCWGPVCVSVLGAAGREEAVVSLRGVVRWCDENWHWLMMQMGVLCVYRSGMSGQYCQCLMQALVPLHTY